MTFLALNQSEVHTFLTHRYPMISVTPIADPSLTSVMQAAKSSTSFALFMPSLQAQELMSSVAGCGMKLLSLSSLISDRMAYGIAMRKGSDLRFPVANAVLELHVSGRLQRMKDSCWPKDGGAAVQCSQ